MSWKKDGFRLTGSAVKDQLHKMEEREAEKGLKQILKGSKQAGRGLPSYERKTDRSQGRGM